MAGFDPSQVRGGNGRWVKSGSATVRGKFVRAAKGVNTGETHGPKNRPIVLRRLDQVSQAAKAKLHQAGQQGAAAALAAKAKLQKVGVATADAAAGAWDRAQDPGFSVATRNERSRFDVTAFPSKPASYDKLFPAKDTPKGRVSILGSRTTTYVGRNVTPLQLAQSGTNMRLKLETLAGGVRSGRGAAPARFGGLGRLMPSMPKMPKLWSTQTPPAKQVVHQGGGNPNFAKPTMVMPQRQKLSAATIDMERRRMMSQQGRRPI